VARPVRLLGPAEIRALAARLGLRPTKSLGQNFVHDPNTVRRIVAAAGLAPDEEVVLEVGPGLGSLTLGLLAAAGRVHAVEIDPVLAGQLPATVAEHAFARSARLRVHHLDALRLRAAQLGATAPTALVANLPYNVAVPVLLHLLAELPTLRHGLVMVQREVADRLTAAPGSKVYGAPTVKLAWYARARPAGRVPSSVFWPVPHVESGLVAFNCTAPPSPLTPAAAAAGAPAGPPGVPSRAEVFAVIDAAFGQRRKMLRSALACWAGGPDRAADLLSAAGVAPTTRGEQLDLGSFVAIAAAGKV
jgi:16S rRNA (adenine1518-N6/adenine1519-N6)-dimethyltransferase